MEKEGAALVDRPRNISAGEILSGGMRVLLTRYGDRFRKMRRYAPMHPYLAASHQLHLAGHCILTSK